MIDFIQIVRFINFNNTYFLEHCNHKWVNELVANPLVHYWLTYGKHVFMINYKQKITEEQGQRFIVQYWIRPLEYNIILLGSYRT